MSKMRAETGGGPKIEPGLYAVTCTAVHDETLPNPQYGTGEIIRFDFTFDEVMDADGEPAMLDAIASKRLTPKSKLWEWSESLLNRELKIDDEIDTDEFMACQAMVQVIIDTKADGSQWSKIDKVLPMPKQGASKAEVPMESRSISDWWVALRSLGFTRQDVMEASNKLFEREPAELKVEQRRQLVVSLTAK